MFPKKERSASLGSTATRSPGQIQADKIAEFVIPPGMTAIQHLQRNQHGRYVVAKDSSLGAYRKFLDLNTLDKFAKNCSLKNGEVIIDENFDSPETPIHTRLCSWWANSLAVYFYTLRGSLAAGCSIKFFLNEEITDGLNSNRPDLRIEFRDVAGNIKIIVLVFNYAVQMDATVDKINEMLQYPNVELAVMFSVKYPINSVAGPLEALRYDPNDGFFCFTAFPKPPPNKLARPQRVVSFGNRVENRDRQRVLGLVNATGTLIDMEGNRVTTTAGAPDPVACNAASAGNPAFNYQFADDMMFLVGGTSILNLGGAANLPAFLATPAGGAVPRLSISLFDVHTELVAAINRMNQINMEVVRIAARW